MTEILNSIDPNVLLIAAVIIGGFALRFAFSIWQELLALAIVPTAFMVGVFSFWPETDLGEELYAGFFIFFAICLAINKLKPEAQETEEDVKA
ncbi:hypothetical protein [uncultured Kiloniella sp.]|uniref:hypothetical protein n=1 Tax=uncultured Kiloniella sp. TaxID=1133091 RepID=UPI0026060170|nr:hypothetical protein [uncultured Kiloniella sp.]